MDSIDYFDKRKSKSKSKEKSLEEEWNSSKNKSKIGLSNKKKDPPQEGPVSRSDSEEKAKDL